MSEVLSTDTDRFVALTKKVGSGCVEWQGSRQVRGYGRLNMGGRYWIASRLSYTLFVGPIPAGLHVLHRCDNPPCVNPAHLWVGTSKDNMQDRERKGRRKAARGSGHGMAELCETEVTAIREAYAGGGTTYSVLARKYGVDQSLIGLIVTRKIWRHL